MKVVAGITLLAAVVLSPVWADQPAVMASYDAPADINVAAESLGGAPQATTLAGAEEVSATDEQLPAEQAVQAVDNSTASAFAHDLSPLGMYQAADWVVKAVMLGLLFASVLTWAVWVYKTIQLRVHRNNSMQVLAVVAQADNFADAEKALVALNLKQENSSALAMVSATELELKLSAAGQASVEGIKERVGARLDRVLSAGGSYMNKGTGVLATIGSTAPFVGLFGTVWGIMNSFIGIAESQTTNLAVVAPGIAEALLATAIGLVAAIPAVVIYNHFARAIAVYRADLADIATALLTLVSRDLDRQQVAGG